MGGGENKWLGLLYVAPYLIGLLVFTAIPFGASFYLSFTDYPLLSAPVWVGIQNYVDLILYDRTFHRALRVTLTYVFITVPLKLTFALFIAYVLNYKLKFIGFFRTAYYVPSILGGSVAIAVLWRYIFADIGLVNMVITGLGFEAINFFGDPRYALLTITLLRVWQFGSAMVIFLAGLRNVPRELYESAEIDGAGALSRFRNITLPLLTPLILYDLIIGLSYGLQVFTQAYVMTAGGARAAGPDNSLLFYVFYIYKNAFQYTQMGYAEAMAVVLFIISLLLAFAVFRWARGWVYYEAA
jgi:oligogalacturonide transport system permease protein